MLAIVQILAILAALVHVYIFALESLRFGTPQIHRGIFGVAAEDVEAVRPWAFNQGFYNLFLGAGALVGAILVRPVAAAGWALIVMSCGSMLLAALVLVATDRRMIKAAASQGTVPALALLAALTQL